MIKLLIDRLKKSKLLKSGFWYTVGNVLVKGINFLTIPIFTNVMTVSEYGFANNYLAVVSLFSLVIGLSLNSAINNAYFEFKEKFHEYLSSALSLSFISFLLFLIIGNAFFYFTDELLGLNHWLFMLMLFHSYGRFLVDYISSYYTIQVKYYNFLAISLLNTLLNVGFSLAFIFTVFVERPDLGRIFGSSMAFITMGIIIIVFIMAKGKTIYNKKYWKFALTLAIPLIPHALSNLILSQADRIMLNDIAGSYDAGIYSYIHNLGVVLSIIWMSANKAWVPWFYEKMDEKNYKHITKTSRYYIIFFAIVTFGSMLVMIDVARLLAPQEYHVGIPLIISIMLGYYFQFLYSLPVNIEFYLKKTQYIALGTVITAITNVVLNAIFIPMFSYFAAGITTMISYLILFLLHYFISKKFIDRKLFDSNFIFLVSTVLIILSILINFLIDYVILRYTIVLILVVIGVLNARKLWIGRQEG